ncbi:hypothetical protein, partial [Spirosoma sp. 209]|uniref:hypothetical protein n=1 Tax=Spirosoma sp. 209 TaxID=1955701 RepID=UPI001116B0B3
MNKSQRESKETIKDEPANRDKAIPLFSSLIEHDKAIYGMQKLLQKAEAKGIATRIVKGGRALVTDDSVHYLRSYIVRSNQYLLYYSGGIKMPGTHFDYPEFRDFEKRIVSEKSPLAPNYEKACEIAKKLSSQYDISVAVLDHDRDFYADEFIKKSIQEDIYFVSA